MVNLSKRLRFKYWAVIIAVLLCCPYFLYALPSGENVIEGNATFDRSEPNALRINTPSDKLIVEYNSFNIADNESVYFTQPTVNSMALTRVTSSGSSNISGLLSANGVIYLVNPSGINIAPTARIDVAALVASTLNIANADFLNGRNNFFKDGNNASILNQGNIIIRNGGYVCLLSQAVENRGTILANLGTVLMASGERMTLALDDLNQISVVIDEVVREAVFAPDGNRITSAVKNSGSITANGGKVILTAKVLNHAFDYAINNSGIIQAKSLVNHNGVVELVGEGAPILNAGTIEANEVKVSSAGAEFTNTGKIEAKEVKVSVTESEFINQGEISTDGNEQMIDGGRVSIEAGTIAQLGSITANAFEGGDAGDITIISESSTVLGERSQTEARALGIVGNGGRIIIDSRNGNTLVDKNAVIDVSAGLVSGNGGFIEVSAFDQLGFYGVLNARAPPGFQIGTAIFDPTNATVGGKFEANTTIWATNSITINDDATISIGVTLKLFADHNSATAGDWHDGVGAITRSGSFTISGKGGAGTRTLIMKAGSGIGTSTLPILTENISNISADLNPNAGSGGIFISQSDDKALTLSSATTRDGDISITAVWDLTVTTATAGGTGTITLRVTTANRTLTTDTITAIDNDITLTADSIAITGTVNAGTGDITLNGNTTFTGTLTLGSGAALTINGNLSISLAAATLNASSGTVDLNGDFRLSAGTFTAPTGNFNISGSFTLTGGTFTHSSGTTIFDSAVAGKTITSGGTSFYNLTFNGAGADWTLQDSLDMDNNLTLTAGTLDVSVNSYSITIGGNFTLTGGAFTARQGSVTFDDRTKASTITGSITFFNFTSTTAGKVIIFEAGSTQVIGGALNLTGAFGDFIILRSSASTSPWSTAPRGSKSISFVDVQDSRNINNSAIITANSKNTGNNTHWYFFEELLAGQQSGSIVLRSVLPDSWYLTQFQVNIFVPTGGPVYLYHPLTPSDISAFEEIDERGRRG